MVNINEIIETYKKECFEATPAERKVALDKANEALKGTGISLNPDKNAVLPSEAAVVCEDVNKINGFALLDTGTGSLDKVEIINGKLKYSVGDMYALVIISDKIAGDVMYEVQNGVNLVRREDAPVKKAKK